MSTKDQPSSPLSPRAGLFESLSISVNLPRDNFLVCSLVVRSMDVLPTTTRAHVHRHVSERSVDLRSGISAHCPKDTLVRNRKDHRLDHRWSHLDRSAPLEHLARSSSTGPVKNWWNLLRRYCEQLSSTASHFWAAVSRSLLVVA